MHILDSNVFACLPTAIQYKIMTSMVKNNYEVNNYNEKYGRSVHDMIPAQKHIIDIFLTSLLSKDAILDLGCGNGALYTTYLVYNGCMVTGVDVSARQLDQAKRLLPAHDFVLSDYFRYRPRKKFSGITAFFSVYNMPRKQHRKLLKRCYRWLDDGGRMLVNVRVDAAGDVTYWKDWCGAPIMFSYYTAQEFAEIAKSIGFHVSMFRITDNPEYKWFLFSKNDDLPAWL